MHCRNNLPDQEFIRRYPNHVYCNSNENQHKNIECLIVCSIQWLGHNVSIKIHQWKFKFVAINEMHHWKRKNKVTKNQPVLKTLSAFSNWNCSNFFNISFNLASISSSVQTIWASSGVDFCCSWLHADDKCWSPTNKSQNSYSDIYRYKAKLTATGRRDVLIKNRISSICSRFFHKFSSILWAGMPAASCSKSSSSFNARWMKQLYQKHVFLKQLGTLFK